MSTGSHEVSREDLLRLRDHVAEAERELASGAPMRTIDDVIVMGGED